jgi:putative membrane protein
MEPVAWQHLVENLVAAAVFSGIGIVLFVLGFIVFDKLTPGSLWKEILDDQNTALAILMAGIAIALAIIIAAAVT